MRAIITGATGAIGTALIEECINQNIEVLVFVRKESVRNGNLPEHELVTKLECSMEELSGIENATGKSWDVFYHLAWAGASGPGRHDMYLQNANVKYALDAVEAAKRFGCRRFIGIGSQAEYGLVEQGIKLSADTPVKPYMGYGYAKLCAGFMTRERATQLEMEHIWVRVLSVYGPNDGANAMLPAAIKKLLNNEVPGFTKGEQQWDYLYSGDAAKALILVAQKGKNQKVYCLGSGQARPLYEYIDILKNETSPDGKVNLGEVPYGENQIMYLCANIDELTADTGWKPETDFRTGIRRTIEKIKEKDLA